MHAMNELVINFFHTFSVVLQVIPVVCNEIRKPARQRRAKRYCFLCTYACLVIGLSCFTTLSFIDHLRLSACLARHRGNETVDQQDQWRYQNSITGAWFYWRTVYKKQDNDTEWRVNWLNVAPTSYLGVIVYLAKRGELNSLRVSLTQLSRLLANNPRPVVVFHEGDIGDNVTQLSLAQAAGSRTPLGFERIQFHNGSNRPGGIYRRYPVGYLHMCRFFALMLPTHPLLTLFSFYWRLDAHSYIFGSKPIKDPFEIMEKRRIQYAFVMGNEEGEMFANGLWSFFHQFLDYHCLKPSSSFRKTQTGWFGGYSQAIFFTNFAIANVSVFRDHSLIRGWLNKVDHNGGIYRSRWGDAPLHTLALTQFIDRKFIGRFTYFGYFHRAEYVCAKGTGENLCKKQAQPFSTDPTTEYHRYPDGCAPYRNPLCRHYPEIKL
jgi:hypothetical protein